MILTFPSFSLSAEQVENAGDDGWLPILLGERPRSRVLRFVGDSCDDARRKYAKPSDEELKRWAERKEDCLRRASCRRSRLPTKRYRDGNGNKRPTSKAFCSVSL